MPCSSEASLKVNRSSSRIGGLKRIAKFLLMATVWAVVCFAGAGRLDWTRGWIYIETYVFAMTAVGVVVHRINPDLIEEREKLKGTNTQRFDKVFLALFLPLTFIQLMIAGIDAVRFHWLALPTWTAVPGVVLFLAAMALVTWTMVVNRFAEPTVRLQSDRGHKVVSAGPYRWVRHPMYVGFIVMYPASALILGSGWAMVVAGIVVILITWRTSQEDRFLCRELEGYREFAAETRFRLCPGLW